MLSGCCLPDRFSVPSSESHNVRPLPHRLSALQRLPYGSQKLSLWQHSVPGYRVPVLRQAIPAIRKPPALPGYKSHISSLPETHRESIFGNLCLRLSQRFDQLLHGGCINRKSLCKSFTFTSAVMRRRISSNCFLAARFSAVAFHFASENQSCSILSAFS